MSHVLHNSIKNIPRHRQQPSPLLVLVAQNVILDIHDLPDLDGVGHVGKGEGRVESDILVRDFAKPGKGVRVRGVGTSNVGLSGGPVLLLPLVPDAVDLGVVEEEERVAGGGVGVCHLKGCVSWSGRI